jgi:hypothetical protein
MRSLVLLAMLGVMGLAFWAYQENYRTQAAAREAERLSAEIGALRERLALLNAEWAYLNRPERLAELADINFEVLALVPFAPEQFGAVEQVAFPPDPATLIVREIVETRGALGEGEDSLP